MMILEVIGGILLTILKIIGIVLLIIVGLIIFAGVSVLFVPIRYSGRIVGDMENREVKADANVSWFLHFISIKIRFEENKVKYFLKIFGIKFVDSEKKKEPEITTDKREELLKTETEKTSTTVSENKKVHEEKPEIKAEKPRKKTEKKASGKIEEILDKLKNIRDKKNEYVSFLSTRESKQAIKRIKEIIFALLRSILPRKISGNISYGFTAPDTTGKIYGILMVLFNGRLADINIEPDFNDVEKTFVFGDVSFKGRIRLVVFLIAAIKLYRTKRLREFINWIKK